MSCELLAGMGFWGFFPGVWDGFTVFISLAFAVFFNVTIHRTCGGWWYEFGCVIGTGLAFGFFFTAFPVFLISMAIALVLYMVVWIFPYVLWLCIIVLCIALLVGGINALGKSLRVRRVTSTQS